MRVCVVLLLIVALGVCALVADGVVVDEESMYCRPLCPILSSRLRPGQHFLFHCCVTVVCVTPVRPALCYCAASASSF